MKPQHLLTSLCATVLTLSAASANAALHSRLGGLAYYDDVADLTWLADANYSAGIYGAPLDWATANEWVSSLSVAGVDGWRLPSALNADGTGPCTDFNCTDSELGNMFYNVLGGSAYSDIAVTHNANYDLFSNIVSGGYWSGTERTDATTSAWMFRFDTGGQRSFNKSIEYYAWAVQSGDVAAVPIPAALWLFGSGLIGLMGVARRKSE